MDSGIKVSMREVCWGVSTLGLSTSGRVQKQDEVRELSFLQRPGQVPGAGTDHSDLSCPRQGRLLFVLLHWAVLSCCLPSRAPWGVWPWSGPLSQPPFPKGNPAKIAQGTDVPCGHGLSEHSTPEQTDGAPRALLICAFYFIFTLRKDTEFRIKGEGLKAVKNTV